MIAMSHRFETVVGGWPCSGLCEIDGFCCAPCGSPWIGFHPIGGVPRTQVNGISIFDRAAPAAGFLSQRVRFRATGYESATKPFVSLARTRPP